MSPAVPSAGTATALESPLPTHVIAVPDSTSSLTALPALAPPLPDAGRRAGLEPLPGSADALVLAQIATRCAAERRMLAVVAADALATARLADEIAYFAP